MGTAGGPVTGGVTGTSRSPDGASVTVTLRGRLDAVRAPAMRQEFDGLLAAGARDVVVDLAAVTFLDSAALAALVRLRRLCAAVSGTVTLVRPDTEDAMRIFQLTQFDRVFTIVSPSDRP